MGDRRAILEQRGALEAATTPCTHSVTLAPLAQTAVSAPPQVPRTQCHEVLGGIYQSLGESWIVTLSPWQAPRDLESHFADGSSPVAAEAGTGRAYPRLRRAGTTLLRNNADVSTALHCAPSGCYPLSSTTLWPPGSMHLLCARPCYRTCRYKLCLPGPSGET
ncbi:uncharacterized protein LOC128932596 [Callithrix jacchus]